MAKVKITGHASGTGVFTITAPNSNTDRTITLPDASVTLGTDATKLSGTLPAISGASLTSVNAVNTGRKNLIINGDMRVQQRGTGSVTSGYFVDRFTLSACSASAVLTSSTPTEFPTAISVSATSGNPIIIQKIESKNCQGLSGKTVTASFYAKNISNATTLYVSLQYAGSADNFGSTTTISEQNLGSLSGSWVKYTASWTVPSGGLNGLALNILCAGSSTFTMGVTGVQLEVGSVATDFEHRSYGEELVLCQRYFHKHSGGRILMGWKRNDTAVGFCYYTPAIMRTSPSLAISAYGIFTNMQSSLNANPSSGSMYEYSTSGTLIFNLLSNYSGTHVVIPSWEGQTFTLDSEL